MPTIESAVINKAQRSSAASTHKTSARPRRSTKSRSTFRPAPSCRCWPERSGKTTTLNLIRLSTPDAGDILLDER
jgi:hypothetical protein